MKKVIFTIILISTINLASSQWVFDCYLPHSQSNSDMGIGFASIIDSTTSWVTGRYLTTNSIYIAKRNLNGWKEIINCDIDITADPSAIAARDSNNAWIGTFTDPRVFYTSNGGTNWLLQAVFPSNAHNRVCGIAFSSRFPNIGYAFVDKGNYEGIYILKSSTGGSTWLRDSLTIPGFSGMIASISVVDSTHAWFGLFHNCNNCYESKLVMTSNGGQNWNIIDVYSINDLTPTTFSFRTIRQMESM